MPTSLTLALVLAAATAAHPPRPRHAPKRPPPPPPEAPSSFAASAARSGAPAERRFTLDWYAEAGFTSHKSGDEPWPHGGQMGGAFTGAAGITGSWEGPAIFGGLRFEAGYLYPKFFSGVEGGTAVSYVPELRVGYVVESDLGRAGLTVAGGPRLGHATLGGTERGLGGYHLGLVLQGFRFRDIPRLGPAALFAFLPSTVELGLDHYDWGEHAVSAFAWSLRWGF